MTPEHLDPRAAELLEQVLDLSPEERQAVLNQRRRHEPEVCAQVEELLALASPPSLPWFLECLPVLPAEALLTSEEKSGAVPGERFGDYELLEEVSCNGLSGVYKARQLSLNRVVALKMILAKLRKGQLARFRQEAEAVAQLLHPNVVQIHEISEHHDLPFFCMEFVAGGSLAEKINGTPLPALEAAELLETVARTVQAIHQCGLVHRDLKPGNILLTPEGLPKVSDFGLVKHLDHDQGQTHAGTIMGTPSYMAPEQASGQTSEVGPACDIYALGAILYEMLTGRPPFRGLTPLDTLELVKTQEPVPLQRLNPKVPRDLETMCLKCLQKEPKKRYTSAQDVAEDLRRFQAGEPIRARPVSFLERGIKWAWCRPAVVALIGLVILLVAGGFASVIWQWREAVTKAEAEAQANQEKETLLRLFYFSRVELAFREREVANVGRAVQLLQDCPPRLRRWEWHYVYRLCHEELFTLAGHSGQVNSVAFSPDGRYLASASHDATVRLWDVASGRQVRTLAGSGGVVWAVAWNSQGTGLASAGSDGTVKLWDPETGRQCMALEGHSGEICCLSWSPDGKQLASGGTDLTIRLWDAVTGTTNNILMGHKQTVLSLAFSPDGKQLASAGEDRTVKVWNPADGRTVFTLTQQPTSEINQLAYSPDGNLLASGDRSGFLRVWDARTGKLFQENHDQRGWVYCLAFSPDGKHLAAAGDDQRVCVWGTHNWGETDRFEGHVHAVRALAYSPDGKLIASAGEDGMVKVWETAPGSRSGTRSLSKVANVDRTAWSPDGKFLVSGSCDGTVTLWDAMTYSVALSPRRFVGPINSVAFSPDGRCLAFVTGSDIVLQDPKDARDSVTLPGHKGETRAITFHPDGRRLASAGDDHLVRVWDVKNGRAPLWCHRHQAPVWDVAFSRDGKLLASASTDQTVKVWDLTTSQGVFTLSHTAAVWCVAFSPDGRWLASGGEDKAVRVWDVGNGNEVLTLRDHTGIVRTVAFSPDGTRLASGCQDGTVRLWDTSVGELAFTLQGHTNDVHSVAFSPDGWRLASASDDATIRIWNATPATGIRNGQ